MVPRHAHATKPACVITVAAYYYRMKRFGRKLWVFAVLLLALLGSRPVNAQDKFYYWVTPDSFPSPSVPDSFVVEVDSTKKAEIEAIRAQGGMPGLNARIAAGAVPYNKNYYAPGQPVWNWHVAAVNAVFDRNGVFPVPCPPSCDPNQYDDPSDIAANPEQWIQTNGDEYAPVRYWIQTEVHPNDTDALANVSNRGMTGVGEKTVITGFIITGGEPRTVVLRALGPSLSASGVQQPAADPKISVFAQSSTRDFATNDDWRSHGRSEELQREYPSLAPTNDKEAALLVTLMPGRYTMHGSNVDGTEGVLLLEAYDVDSASD